MAEVTRRQWLLYLVAAGVGVAVYREREAAEQGVPLVPVGPAGPSDEGATGGGGGGSASVGGFSIGVGTSLSAIPSVDTYPRVNFVFGDDPDRGVHVEYEASKPITAASDDNEIKIGIGDNLSQVPSVDVGPQYVFIDGTHPDHGVHVRHDETAVAAEEPSFSWGFAGSLGGIPSTDILPKIELATGKNPDYGVHVTH